MGQEGREKRRERGEDGERDTCCILKGYCKKKTKRVKSWKKCVTSVCTRIFLTLGIREHVNGLPIVVLGNWQMY